MYCSRCNLHSEEYIDKCPLCAGPMEVDEVGSGVMKTPTTPERELTDDFPQEDLLELDDEHGDEQLFEEKGDISKTTLSMEQEKIVVEPEKKEPSLEEESEKEKEVPSFREEEYLFEQRDQLYQQGIPSLPMDSGGKRSSPLLLGGGLLVILILIVWGYFTFFNPGKPAVFEKLKGIIGKKETTPINPAVSEQKSVAGKAAEIPLTTKPEEVKKPLSPQQTEPPSLSEKKVEEPPVKKEAVSEAMTGVKQPEPTKPEIKPETKPATNGKIKEPFGSEKPAEALVAKAEKPEKKGESVQAPDRSKDQIKIPEDKTKEVASQLSTTSLPAPDPQGEYSIHVGSFKIKENALALQIRLQNKGYTVSYYSIDLPGKGSWYRVLVGNYTNVKDTQKVASALKRQEKIPALIMKGNQFLN